MNDNRWEIIHGDALKLLPEFAPGTFDAIITDPPYASGGRIRQRKTSPRSANIRAWEIMRRRRLRATPRISGRGHVGQLRGSAMRAASASWVRRYACLSTGGSFRLRPMRCNGQAGSGAAQQFGTRATAVRKRDASGSRLSTSCGVPMGICRSTVRCLACQVSSSMAIRSTAFI